MNPGPGSRQDGAADDGRPQHASGRRAFLTGRAAARPPLRPPGALDEAAFVARCTRCDACRQACPAAIIARGSGGYPELSFASGECSFCGDCAAACSAGALRPAPYLWRAKAHIGTGCLAASRVLCRACGDACAPRAIRFDLRRPGAPPQRDAEACTGCGACVRACPACAIEVRAAAALTQYLP